MQVRNNVSCDKTKLKKETKLQLEKRATYTEKENTDTHMVSGEQTRRS